MLTGPRDWGVHPFALRTVVSSGGRRTRRDEVLAPSRALTRGREADRVRSGAALATAESVPTSDTTDGVMQEPETEIGKYSGSRTSPT